MDNMSTLTPFELKERIDRLRESAKAFEQDARKYQEELDRRDQKECEQFVGKCYRTVDKYFKIIGTPQFILTMARTYYERYQFPAIIAEVDGTTFDDIYEDTVFRALIDPIERETGTTRIFPEAVAEEITEGEFDEFIAEKVRQATGHVAAVEKFVNR